MIHLSPISLRSSSDVSGTAPVRRGRCTPFLLACVAGLVWSAPACCAPFVPKDGGEVLERLRDRPFDATARELPKLRTELARDPQNLRLATTIARRYVDEARSQGDPRYLGYAEGALSPWWTLPQPPASVLMYCCGSVMRS